MAERERDLGVYFLDVGQGDATVLLPPSGEGDAIVVDCRDDVVVTKLLDQWQVRRIGALVVSHLDWDHIAGVRQLLRHPGLEVECIYINPDRNLTEDDPGAMEAKALLDEVRDGCSGRRWEVLGAKRDRRPVASGDGWKVTLLAPEHVRTIERERSGRWEDPNRLSVVLRVERAGTVVLVGGDAPLATWAEIPEEERRARVFRVPHHGGRLDGGGVPEGWDVDRLYREAALEEAVLSVGTRNGYGHPDPRWVAPLRGGACRLRCTQVTERCQPGIREDAATYRRSALVKPFLVEPQWRHCEDRNRRERRPPEVPCAGTVLVSLGPDGAVRVWPEARAHTRVVESWSTPLCRDRS